VIKGFFFDLDGTLVNTYQADYLAYKDAVFEIVGKHLIREEYEQLHGIEIGAKLKQLLPELSKEQVADIRQSKKRHYANHVHLTQPNDALISFLAQFSPQLTCALVTTAKNDNIALVLKQHNLAQFFSVIVSGDDVTRPKPDPQAYTLALVKTGLSPHEVIAFEDSPSGIQSAEAAGIAVVPVKEFALA
jgi:beta-phosphoglucomutase